MEEHYHVLEGAFVDGVPLSVTKQPLEGVYFHWAWRCEQLL